MTERRPHWDTELEQSVSAILFDCYNNGVSEEQVYQAIAAVEDWVLSAPIFDLYLSRKHAPDKAAIARVRVMAEAALAAHNELEGTYATVSAKALLRALDGGTE